jgi:xanthine dehydrogenase small subunit
MAISKVALGATARLESESVRELRVAAASLAAFPTRLYRTEDALRGKPVDPDSIRAARAALLGEVIPIDDIRSTADYRGCVAANLLEEFLTELKKPEGTP